ncbi:LNS2-domain-containing protein [Xylaria arbuscula]|nr:LNS2-domain-containing protein [Xylaria arbuscula]
MQYVRNISDSVSTAWNSINPATLSGAIDVIVVEQENGDLFCSPFHVRFGKFSLLRPYEKKVEFKVNGLKQEYAMKLGEGGEAFFVFETSDKIPQSLQTSPLVSPETSPSLAPAGRAGVSSSLQEPDLLQLDGESARRRGSTVTRPGLNVLPPHQLRSGVSMPATSSSPELDGGRPSSRNWLDVPTRRSPSRESTSSDVHAQDESADESSGDSPSPSQRSRSPPPIGPLEAVQRAMILSQELSAVNIPTRVTDSGDLMLDMASYKGSEEDAIKAEILARKILSEVLQGDYDIGALFGMDEEGNLWIYSSEEAKEAAMKKTVASLRPAPTLAIDAASDPGYASDESTTSSRVPVHRRSESDVGQGSVHTPPTTPGSASTTSHHQRSYAKTLRLTSDQLKALDLKPGENSMSFTVNRATCNANMFLWRHDIPVVISDIDGTITKSDALGQVLNMIGRDWTHTGVAKLYSDIVANGYNIMYLTSRSVGQSDTTRAYLNGITQDGYRLPKGPTILSPDRTMAALRREIYLRKPHVFKMATLRDIRSLYGPENRCFYAGFGNRLTDQISYRTVDVPRNRIFTINSNAEVSLDLLSLNKLKLSYVNMGEVVDHYFPPISTLVKGGGVEYTDFTFWRDTPLELDEFSASGSDLDNQTDEDEEEDEDVGEMGDSFLSRGDDDDDAYAGHGVRDGEEEDMLDSAIYDRPDDADDEEGEDEEDENDDEEEEETVEYSEDENDTIETQPGTVKSAVADTNAQIMTGMKNLGIQKKG